MHVQTSVRRFSGTTWSRWGLVVLGSLLVNATLGLAARAQEDSSAAVGTQIDLSDWSRQYVDVDGQPLGFTTEDQIVRFLETAEIVDEEVAEKGINNILRVTLEKNRVRAYAAFRSVDDHKQRYRLPNRRVVPMARDSYRYEPAAYRLSRLIGLPTVPPAVLRRYKTSPGSLQLWVGNVKDEEWRRDSGAKGPVVLRLRQTYLRHVFDNLIANYDRNQGNILIDPETWRVWLIDHSRSFLAEDRLLEPDLITHCDRLVYERLRGLDEETLRNELSPFLSTFEIKAIAKRKKLIIQMLEARIDERGHEGVLFNLDPQRGQGVATATANDD